MFTLASIIYLRIFAQYNELGALLILVIGTVGLLFVVAGPVLLILALLNKHRRQNKKPEQ